MNTDPIVTVLAAVTILLALAVLPFAIFLGLSS